MKKSIGAKDYCDFILNKIEDAAGVIISGSVDLIDYLEASLSDESQKSGEEAVFRLSGIHTALFSPFSAIELSIRRIDELFEIVEKTAILESIQDESRVLLDKFGYETYKKYDALLQDALDLDMATDSEKEDLLEWRKYRVLLARIQPEDATDIEWPVKPA